MPLKREESSIFFLPPTVLKQADVDARTLLEAGPKVKALLTYLNLHDQDHFEACFSRVGKSLNMMHQGARLAAAEHMGSSNIASESKKPTVLRSGKVPGGLNGSNRTTAQIEKAKKEAEHLSSEEVFRRLNEIFVGYCSKPRLVATGRNELDLTGFARLLRDSRLLDNNLTMVQVDAVLSDTKSARGREEDIQEGETFLDFEAFLGRLQKAMVARAATAVLGRPRTAAMAATSSQTSGGRLSVSGNTALGGVLGTSQHVGSGVPRVSISGARGLPAAQLPAAIKPRDDPDLIAVARSSILPLNRHQEQVRPIDTIFTPPMMAFLRKHDARLKEVYGWYASLEEVDPQRVTWESVRLRGCSMGRTEFVLMLLNFEVLPALMHKHEALALFSEYFRDSVPLADPGKGDPIFQTDFVEVLSRVAIFIADNARMRIQDFSTSPDDLYTLHRYVKCCSGDLRLQLEAAYDASMAQRTHRLLLRSRQIDDEVATSGGAELAWKQRAASPERPWLHSCGKDPLLAAVKHRSWENKMRDEWKGRMNVMSRREDLRMKHALTRLQNFYRDVRTTENNSVWVPRQGLVERGGGAALHGSLRRNLPLAPSSQRLVPHAPSPTPVGAAGAGHPMSSNGPLHVMVPGDQTPNEVSWFSGSQQIKTPKPVTAAAPRPPLIQLPVLHEDGHHGGEALHAIHAAEEVGRSAASGAVSPGAFPLPPLLYGVDPSEVLGAVRGLGKAEALQFVSSFIHRDGHQPQQAAAKPSTVSPQAPGLGKGSCWDGGSAVGSPRQVLEQRSGFADLANLGWMVSPKAALAPVEPRDEFEEVFRIAERLPSLRSITPS